MLTPECGPGPAEGSRQMVKALIATAILALALVFGGYALERTTTPDAAAQVENADQFHNGCSGDKQRDRDSREEGRGSYGHGDHRSDGREDGDKQYQDGRDDIPEHHPPARHGGWR